MKFKPDVLMMFINQLSPDPNEWIISPWFVTELAKKKKKMSPCGGIFKIMQSLGTWNCVTEVEDFQMPNQKYCE